MLFLFSSVGIFTTNINTPPLGEPTTTSSGGTTIDSMRSPTAPPQPEGPTWDGSEYLYSGLGQTLPSQEFSHGETATLGVTDLDFGESMSGQIDIPQGWTGYHLTASVFNLYDKISHITGSTRNGNFESGTTSPQYWVESQRGLPVSDPEIDGLSWNWGTNWGDTGNGINVWANMSSSAYWWTSNATYIEYVGWTQTIDLNRIDPTYAWLSFDVRFYDDGVHGRDDDDEMAVYAEVGGVERVFVCHRYCMNARVSGDWSFHNIAFSLTPDELQSWTSDTINVTVGMTVDFDWDVNNYFGMDFDDVELIVRGKVSPTANGIQLRLNSTSLWVNPTYGSGTISLTGTWGPYASNNNIVATWTTVSAISRDVDFNYTLTLYIKRSKTTEAQTGPEGSAFSVKHGLNASWTTWFFANFYSTYYNNYNFTIQKPAGGIWSLSSVTDPNLDPKTADVLAQSNATHWRLPASLINAFGWWQFTFTSFNQIDSITPLQSIYRISPRTPSTLSTTVTFDSVTTGNVNMTIYNSEDPNQPMYSDPDPVSGGTHLFTVNFNDGDLFPAGSYNMCISYDNGPDASHAGFYHDTFDIEHDSSLIPETTPLSVIYGSGSGFFYPRVSYHDIDTIGSPFIDNDSETVTVTGQVSGYPQIIFRQSGSLYQAIVPDNYVPPGDHNLQVTANDPFFDSAGTTIALQVRSDTTLSSPTPGYTAYYQETFTLSVFFEDSVGAGISGAATWFTTPGWSGTSITPGGSAGWYDIQADSDADGREPGTHTLTVTVTDPSDYYKSQTLQFTIVVRARNTLLTSTTPSSVPYGASSQFTITLEDLDGGSPPTNSTNRLHLSLWRGGTRWNPPDATIVYSGTPGEWDITVDTGVLPSVGDFIFEVRFEWYHVTLDNAPFYGNRTVDVTVSTRLVGTSITYDPPNPIPINDDADITIYYQQDDPPYFSTAPIFDIIKADVTVILNGTNLGTGFGWSPQLDGSYILTIFTGDLNQVSLWEIEITIDQSGDSYQGASRIIQFSVRKRLTQVIVDPPAQTPYQENTIISFSWYDLDGGADPLLTDIYQVIVSGYGSPQTFTSPGSWSITLVTNTWTAGTYNLVLTIIPDDPPGEYNQASSAVTVRVIIHQTAVTILAPEPTPVNENTTITIQWIDLSLAGQPQIHWSEADYITVTGAITQTFSTVSSWTLELDTDGLSIGVHSITITVYALTSPTQIYDDGSGSFDSLTVREHRVYVAVTGPPPVPEDGVIFISINWTDLDSNNPIGTGVLDNVTVTYVSGPPFTPSLPYTNYTHLEFYIDAFGWDPGTYRLRVSVYSSDPDYADGWGEVNIVIRVHSITADVDPIPRVPYGNNISITLRVDDSDLGSALPEHQIASVIITGGWAPITLDTPALWAMWVSNGTAGDGIYIITLDVSSWPLGTYNLQISVNTNSKYGNGVVFTSLIVRELDTGFTYTVAVTVPYDEPAYLNVSYFVADPGAIQDGTGLSGGTITIAELTGSDFTYQDHGDGNYTITFLLSALGPPGDYYFTIDISSPAQYKDRQLQNVKLTVRELLMWLHAVDVPQTPYGDDVVIDVAYEVQDTDSSQNGDRIAGATIRINQTNLVIGVDYSVVWIGASQVYRITIFQSVVSDIQWYWIQIVTTSTPVGYASDSITRLDFQVRTVEATLQVVIPDPLPWGDIFNITVIYINNDPDSSQLGKGILGVSQNITLLGYAGQYTVNPLALDGYYEILINSSAIGAPATYPLTIQTAWTLAPPPYSHEVKAISVTIEDRPTDNAFTPAGEYGFADNIVVNFTYMDVARSDNWILNSTGLGSNVILTLYWKSKVTGFYETLSLTHWNSTELSGGSYAFMLEIEADFYGVVDTFYDFRATISWTGGTPPYYLSTTFDFRAYVSGSPTDIILQPTGGATPYGDVMIFTILFQTEGGSPITNVTPNHYVHINLTLQGDPSFGEWITDWWFTNDGNGYYSFHIETSRLPGIATYYFIVNVTYDDPPNPTPSPFYQSHYNLIFPMQVRAIDTQLIPEIQVRDFFWGEDIYVNVTYWDRDHDIGILAPINISVTYGGSVTEDPTITPYAGEPGKFRITFSTALLDAGEYVTFTINANKTFYNKRSVEQSIYLEPLPITIEVESITTDSDLVNSTDYIEQYYGLSVTIVIKITDYWGELVNDSNVQFDWEGPLGSFIFLSAGRYNGTLDATYDVARYPVYIRAGKALAYAEVSHYFSFVIKDGPSTLTAITPLNQIVYIGENMTITVQYEDGNGDPINLAFVDFTHARIGYVTLTEVGSTGIYNWTDFSHSFGVGVYAIVVTAEKQYLQSQTELFTIDVRTSDAQLIPLYEAENSTLEVMYLENFTITVVMYDETHNLNISLATIESRWDGYPSINFPLSEYVIGHSFYTFEFPANLTKGVWELTLTWEETATVFGFTCDPLVIRITIVERTTADIDTVRAISVLGSWNTNVDLDDLTIPYGDFLYIYYSWNATDGTPIEDGGGLATVGLFSEDIQFDRLTGYYLLILNTSKYGLGPKGFSVSLTKPNFQSQTTSGGFTVIRIPMALTIERFEGYASWDGDNCTVWVGTPIELTLNLTDTWHGLPITGAEITMPFELFTAYNVTELVDGLYYIWAMRSTTEIVLEFEVDATKWTPGLGEIHENHQTVHFDMYIQYHPIFVGTTTAGLVTAVILIIVLIAWVMWVRVYSIPWQVRRMRKLAKTIEKDEGFELSRKDMKTFQAKEITLKDKLTTAMGTIGVAATPAMMPAIEEIEEVTATEEDIMGELDKIPGLGPEEKAVLAEEMRKIPRKDRIWFLDDLRKQMGTRRMDFLTQRELGEVTELPEEAAPPPTEAPPTEAPPDVELEEVEAAEPPPPDKALTEDRTAPTVVPPEFQPPPVDPKVEAEIMRELNKIPGLESDEKQALLDHLKYLSKEERQATYNSLRQSASRGD
jgi:hypothetical protein